MQIDYNKRLKCKNGKTENIDVDKHCIIYVDG
jgi:hypothetical protein